MSNVAGGGTNIRVSPQILSGGPLRSTTQRFCGALVALVLTTAGIAACGDDDATDGASGNTSSTAPDADPVSIPIVTVTAIETETDDGSTAYALQIDDGLTAGPTQFNLRNNGSEPHHMQIFRLNDDATPDDFGAALATGDIGALLGTGAFMGGTGTADPGSESAADALIDIAEGNYALLCFIEDANGVPHLALGMVTPFSVAAADGEVAAMPEPDAVVDMVDFSYDNVDLPTSGIVEVVNVSETQVHEMNLLRLADGASAADVGKFFEGELPGPPPFSGVGGMQALMPKGSQLLVLDDLEPGGYVMICHVPDPTDGVPHDEKGMAVPATVS